MRSNRLTSLHSAIEHLTLLLDSDVSATLSQLAGAESVVGGWLERNRRVVERKMADLRAQSGTVDAINDLLAKRIVAVETAVAASRAWQPLHTVDGLRATTEMLMPLCPDDRRRGTFLTARAAHAFLDRHPPTRLQAFFRRSTEAAPDPLALLALTRHTESMEWQAGYLDMLSRAAVDDFEPRAFTYRVYDSSLYRDVLSASEAAQKPWRISHNKEAGVINLFTLEEDHHIAAPLLQAIAVTIHYIFEVTSAGRFFNHVAHHSPSSMGTRVVNTITTTRERLPQFRPNLYSEHMYWDEAMDVFWRAFGSPETAFFADAFYAGDRIGDGSCAVSFNAIDVLWNVNLLQLHETRKYFGGDASPFLYHFRDAAWYEVLREAAGHSISEMRTIIGENLDLGDVALTDKVIELGKPGT